MSNRKLTVAIEKFPIRGAFTIARGAKTEAVVVTATITDGRHTGHGECVPYGRYGETPASVTAQIENLRGQIEDGLDKSELQEKLTAGAARNALDCALWDLEAKQTGVAARVRARIENWRTLTTAFTISLGSPEKMAADARAASERPVLKIKLGANDGGDSDRIRAVRAAAPNAALIADANEGWSSETAPTLFQECRVARFALIEQPLPAGQEEQLRKLARPVPLCADESLHDRNDLLRLKGVYSYINIKLDKTGGLTEALALSEAALTQGFGLMAGCMVATSLAMAPALLLAMRSEFVDLDGPLLLAKDRDNGLHYEGSLVFPPEPALWG